MPMPSSCRAADAAVRARAARDWCAWEAAHIGTVPGHEADPRYDDPRFQLCFAWLVTHYFRHAAFLEDGQLLRDVDRLATIPGVMAHGRLDVSSPLDIPWRLHQAWPTSELIVVEDAGHSSHGGIGDALTAATARFARQGLTISTRLRLRAGDLLVGRLVPVDPPADRRRGIGVGLLRGLEQHLQRVLGGQVDVDCAVEVPLRRVHVIRVCPSVKGPRTRRDRE